MRERFGWEIVEFPTARMDNADLHRSPQVRAEDLNRAFADPQIDGIVASIGGDDSVRILRYLDHETIAANPKVFLGFSDTTTMISLLNVHGLVTFNGPSVLAGFAQLDHAPKAFAEHIESILVHPRERTELAPFEWWSEGYREWANPEYDGETLEVEHEQIGWQWIQGSGKVEGVLFGGNIEVLEFMKSTRFWMPQTFWEGKILFFETSEEKPTISNVKYYLRNYGVQGVYDQISGILFGRAKSYTTDEKRQLAETIRGVVADEFERADLPIVANLDFGHTHPQWIMPLGVRCEIDCGSRSISLTEACVL